MTTNNRVDDVQMTITMTCWWLFFSDQLHRSLLTGCQCTMSPPLSAHLANQPTGLPCAACLTAEATSTHDWTKHHGINKVGKEHSGAGGREGWRRRRRRRRRRIYHICKFKYIKTSQKRFENLHFLLNTEVKLSDLVECCFNCNWIWKFLIANYCKPY